MIIPEIEKKEIERYISVYDFSAYVKDKTFLITGAKGIVGSGIIKWLIYLHSNKKLSIKIIATTRDPDIIPDYISADDPIKYITYGEEDLNTKECHIDYIIHAASSTDNKYHMMHPFESFRVNYDGTERLIELALKNDGASLIYISSEEVYGITDSVDAIPEEQTQSGVSSTNPRSCYPISKLASEFICLAAASEYSLRANVIRPTGIQGLLQKYDTPRVANEIMRCAVEHRDLELNSDGTTKKCMIYSLDAVAAILIVLFKGEKGGVYNASDPRTFLSVNELAERVFTRFSPDNKVIHKTEPEITKKGYLPHRSIVQDITKIKQLGWEPITDLEGIYKIDIDRFSKDEVK